MKFFSTLCLLPLTISLALFCHNNKYDELATFVLNSDLEGLEKALPDYSLTMGEKTSLRSLAEDMSLKRLKAWESVHCFAFNRMYVLDVPYTRSEIIKTTVAGFFGVLSSILVVVACDSPSSALRNQETGSSTNEGLKIAATGLIMACASIAAIINVGRGWSERYNAAIKSIDDLYTNSIKIRALLHGLA